MTVTKEVATQHGTDFAKAFEKNHDAKDIRAFHDQLDELRKQDQGQKYSMQSVELQSATQQLVKDHVLPTINLVDSKQDQRGCRVVGTTAGGEEGLVVAIGRKQGSDGNTHAETVVVLGQDGKFYKADKTEKGYVKTDKVVAENADELKTKYNKHELDDAKQQTVVKHNPQGKVSLIDDQMGHRRAFQYDEQGRLSQVNMDGHRYTVNPGTGEVMNNDPEHNGKTYAKIDDKGNLVIENYPLGSSQVSQQTIIHADGSMERYEGGKWSHVGNKNEANAVYSQLHRTLQPDAELIA